MTVLEELPLEVLALCFLPLPLRDRVIASHVCHRWRTAAIASPELWRALSFNHRPEQREVLLAILKRSGAGALDATWTFQRSVYCGFDLLETNMWRVKRLSFNSHARDPAPNQHIPERLGMSDAPMLEVVHVDLPTCFKIPARWDDGGAPRLREILVNSFAFDANCRRFNALRRFRGCVTDSLSAFLTGREGDAASVRAIFVLCPRLVELELAGLAQPFFIRGPGPPTLNRLTFSRCWTSIDYAPLLASLAALPQSVVLSNAVDFAPALKLYDAYAREPFVMACHTVCSRLSKPSMWVGALGPEPDEYSIRLHTLGCSYTLTTTIPGTRTALDCVAHTGPYLGNLGGLECPAEFFDRLVQLRETLPVLQSLTITVSGKRPYGDLNYCHFQRSGHIVVPQLRELFFDTTDMNPAVAGNAQGWFLSTLPRTLPAWLHLGLPKLAALHLFLSEHLVLAPISIRPEGLLPFAETVFIGWRDGWEHGIVGRGNWHRDPTA